MKEKSYTDDFKLKVVQEYLMSDAKKSEIQKKYGIKNQLNFTMDS